MAAKKKTAKKTTKKAVKKKNPSKKVVKKAAPKVSARKAAPQTTVKRVRATRPRIMMVTKNLILFLVLSLISYIIYSVSGNEIFMSFFGILSWILGVISLAFLISLLVLLLLRAMKR